jgi:PAS domain S-box-containing protein
LIVDSIPGMVAVADASGEIERVSQPVLDYYGQSLEELKRWTEGGAIHPEDLPGLADAFRNSIRSGDPIEFEARARRFDGVYRWFQTRGHALRDRQGRIVRWYFLQTDVDERKRAEEELRRNQEFLTRAQEISSSGCFSWFVDTNEVTFSEGAYRIFGYEPNSPVTLDRIASRIHPDDLALMEEKVGAARAAGGDQNYEIRLRMPDGSIKYVHTISNLVVDSSGRRQFIGATQDVTQRRLAQEALHRAQSELAHVSRVNSLGALTATMAHEINQPLSGILTNAGTCLRLLSADPPNIEVARETARRTIRDGNRVSDVITRLRTLFGKGEFALEPMNINDAAREIISLTLADLQRNRVVVQLELAEDPPPIEGDRVQLQQVILNLVRNASEAMADVYDRPRNLLIRTETDERGYLRLSVRDAGVGLGRQNMDQLFDSFYTTKSGGMGIGLSVSRSIIERHHGRLWAEANDGPGATFTFSIPCGTRAPKKVGSGATNS